MEQKLNPFELIELHMLRRGLIAKQPSDWLRMVFGVLVTVIGVVSLSEKYSLGANVALAIVLGGVMLTAWWIVQSEERAASVRLAELESRNTSS